MGRKENARFETYLHSVANELIEEAIKGGCSHIVFEELSYIRENISKATWQHIYAFQRFYRYVKYKTEEHGVEVVQVDPKNTSRQGSHCGFTHPNNRSGELLPVSFACQQCGYENHTDYNTGKNIGLRSLGYNQTGDGRLADSIKNEKWMLSFNFHTYCLFRYEPYPNWTRQGGISGDRSHSHGCCYCDSLGRDRDICS